MSTVPGLVVQSTSRVDQRLSHGGSILASNPGPILASAEAGYQKSM
jgi:hypothetical protein